MKIRGRVVIKGKPIADAEIRMWLVKRSDGAEVHAFDGRSVDNGTFEVSQDVLDGLPCHSRHFTDVRYSVERRGYRTVHGTRPVLEEEINLGEIELIREALRVHGRITSNRRPVRAAKVIVHIDDVERACIRTEHDGTFERDIEGHYEGRKLAWVATCFGYIKESGTGEVHSDDMLLENIQLTPRWWTGFAQTFGLDPRIVLGAFLVLFVGLPIWIWWELRCPDVSVKQSHFIKNRATMQDVETNFGECVFSAQGTCGAEKDRKIIACMTVPNRGYQYKR
jgi:hypothetical protein